MTSINCRYRQTRLENERKRGGSTDAPIKGLRGRKPVPQERTEVMLTRVWEPLWFFVVAVPLIFVGLAVIASSVRIVGANESGLVIKRFGPPLASGRIVALNGEAGYQARMLPPGWHFFLWRGGYPRPQGPAPALRPRALPPGVGGYGAAMPSERVLGKAVACTHFQDAEAFLTNGGERGRQITLLTAGTYRINPALFDVITTAGAARTGLTPADLRVYQVQPDRVGIVT